MRQYTTIDLWRAFKMGTAEPMGTEKNPLEFLIQFNEQYPKKTTAEQIKNRTEALGKNK